MIYDRVFEKALENALFIKENQRENILKAASLAAEKIKNGGAFFIFDRGHLLSSELIARSGGPAFARKINYCCPNFFDGGMAGANKLSVAANKAEISAKRKEFEKLYAYELLLENGVTEKDVVLINTNSGKGYPVYCVCEAAKGLGATIIGMTSFDTVKSVSQEGEKGLLQYADVAIDNCVKLGDALFLLDGLDEKIVPESGFAAAFIGWALIAQIIENLLTLGVSPTVYRSVNIEGGPLQNEKAIKNYEERGI